MALRHHDLCFGCGPANLFGLQIELEPSGSGVAGRFFVKQDHQGALGFAHPGVIALALEESMSLAVGEAAGEGGADASEDRSPGERAVPQQFEVTAHASAPVGTFVHLSARVDDDDGDTTAASAEAVLAAREGREGAPARLAQARAVFGRLG